MTTLMEMKIEILEIYEDLVKEGIWTEYIFIEHANLLKTIPNNKVKDTLEMLRIQMIDDGEENY
tara:strand:- start:1264 stop:1455 length:192 start_codon:yes stop_codon:yes gene_type:complete